MAAGSTKYVWVLVFLSVTERVYSTEQGKWTKQLYVNDTFTSVGVFKTLYNQSEIFLNIRCGEGVTSKLGVKWILRWSPCADEYLGIDDVKNSDRLDAYYTSPDAYLVSGLDYGQVEFIKSEETVDCSEHIELKLRENVQTKAMGEPPKERGSRKKREDPPNSTKTLKPTENSISPTKNPPPAEKPSSQTQHPVKDPKPKENLISKNSPVSGQKGLVCRTWNEGVFLFVVQLAMVDPVTPKEPNVNVEISMRNENGYLSAMEWPLLIFYGVMCIVYVVLGLIWLVLLACNWRDLLRVQFWIGGVIVLGMLEKAVFYADFQSINHKGESVPGAIIFAELVSCFKRTVARMLVIIVSLGFGIVKPRLGPMLHKVLGVGSLYFIFAAVEGCFRAVSSKSDQSKNLLLAAVPLALTDAIICWWIFTSLVQTLRTLRLRRNIVKLSLYRHFTNTLVFAVLASIAFMVWSYTQHHLKLCLTDWKELWVDDAYWHLLFSVILIVIMVLWRPTVNNQRYAFSPLLDAADDEADEDVIMSDAFEGMKMRGVRNGSPRQSASSKAEDDLKWVEENIPSTLIDKAIPGVIDSDEEIVTTKLEMAKME